MASNLWSAFFAWLQRLVGEPARSFFYVLNNSDIPAEGINVSFGNTEVCNITAFNRSSSVTLTLTTRDDKGNSKQYSISPNAPLEIQMAQVASFTLTGTGGSILAYFTWPETIPASTTVINGPVTITGNVGRTWNLGSSDVPNRGWSLSSGDTLGGTPITVSGASIDPREIRTLTSTDTPGRAWSLSSSDTLGGTPITVSGATIDPREIRTLTSTDTPGRAWSLSSADVPGRGWNLGSLDLPVIQGETPTAGTYKALQVDSLGNLLRGWTLGASDVPGRGWNLGSSDVPGRGWNLGSSDLPVIQGETPTSGSYKAIQVDGSGNLLRGWTLGSGDVPGRGWNLGSSDVPGRGWTLGSGDKPNRGWTLDITDIITVYGSEGTPVKTDSAGNTQVVPQSVVTLLPPPISDTDSVSISPVAPTVTASVGGNGTGVTSVSVSLSVTAGEFIGVGITQYQYAVSSVSDGVNTYTELYNAQSAGAPTTFYYAIAATTATLTITVTLTASDNAVVVAFAANSPGINIDSSAWAYGSSTAPASSTSAAPSLTPTLAVGVVGVQGTNDSSLTITNPSGSSITWSAIGTAGKGGSGSAYVYQSLFQAANTQTNSTMEFGATLSATKTWASALLVLSPPYTTAQTLTLSVTAGDAVMVSAQMASGSVASVSDSQGNTYTTQLTTEAGLNVYNTTVSTTGTLTITLTFTGVAQELVALDLNNPGGSPTIRTNSISTPVPPQPGVPTMMVVVTNTQSDMNTNVAPYFSGNGLYVGISPTAGTATPVLASVTKQNAVLSYPGRATAQSL